MPTVTIIKPFSFMFPHNPDLDRMPRELKFKPNKDPRSGEYVPTEVEIPDEMAAHPWITRDFADNAIESPARTKARHEKIAAESEKAKAEAARAIREAEDAMRRATGAAQTLAQQDAKVVDDLNTPINQLASRSGIDIGKPINLDSPDVQAALNTPVNVLQANGGKAPEAPEAAEPQAKEDLPNAITFGMKKTATKK